MRKDVLPVLKEVLLVRKEVLPVRKDVLPVRKEVLPVRREVLPVCKEVLPARRSGGNGPRAIGETYLWYVRVGQLFLPHKCCFWPFPVRGGGDGVGNCQYPLETFLGTFFTIVSTV